MPGVRAPPLPPQCLFVPITTSLKVSQKMLSVEVITTIATECAVVSFYLSECAIDLNSFDYYKLRV